MANVCALCSGEKVQTRRAKIEGNHLQYVCAGLPRPPIPVARRAGAAITAESQFPAQAATFVLNLSPRRRVCGRQLPETQVTRN